jgi:hypothetical protein
MVFADLSDCRPKAQAGTGGKETPPEKIKGFDEKQG